MMRAKKAASAVAMIAILAMSFSITNTQPSQAAISCQTGYFQNGWAWGKCTQSQPGDDLYRVVVLCQNIFTKYAYYKYGDIRSVHEQDPSTVNGCNNWFEQYVGKPRTQTIWR